jgi:copper chaperone
MIELTLPTMTCGHCVKTVTRTVQQLDPAATVEIDLPSHRVRIGSDGDAERFRAALADEGYEAARPASA